MISTGGEQRDGDLESPRRLPDMAGADAPPPQVRKNIPPVTPQQGRRGSITDYFNKSVSSCAAGSTVDHETCHGTDDIKEDEHAGKAAYVILEHGVGLSWRRSVLVI